MGHWKRGGRLSGLPSISLRKKLSTSQHHFLFFDLLSHRISFCIFNGSENGGAHI